MSPLLHSDFRYEQRGVANPAHDEAFQWAICAGMGSWTVGLYRLVYPSDPSLKRAACGQFLSRLWLYLKFLTPMLWGWDVGSLRAGCS